MEIKAIFKLKWYWIMLFGIAFLIVSYMQVSIIWECQRGGCDGVLWWLQNYWGLLGLVIVGFYAIIRIIIHFLNKN